jgi:hypothetical protein
MSGIAISYRRSDSSAIAGRIFDRLVLRYGRPAVFMDIEDIPFATDFRIHIHSVLAQADVLLVVIGQRWIGPSAAAGGGARIRDKADPVRAEIETALERKLPIFPVLIDGATMPDEADLPESIAPLAFLNAPEVKTGADFNAHMDRLIKALDRVLPAALVAAADAAGLDAEPDFNWGPDVRRPQSWLSDLMRHLVVPLVALLVAHHLIVNSLDLDARYLRAVAFAVPFLFGFLRSLRSGRGTGSAFAFAAALGVLGVSGMTISASLNSGEPIMPENREEWRENIEYGVSIALAFMVGHALALGLGSVMRRWLRAKRRRLRAIKGTEAQGHRP